MKIERISPARARKRLKILKKRAKALKRQLPDLPFGEIFDLSRKQRAETAWITAEKQLEAARQLEYRIYADRANAPE